MITRLNADLLHWNGFCIPPTQTAVEKILSPVEFNICANTKEYLDFKNTRLHVTCRIIKRNGTDCADANIVAPINDLFNSLWSINYF